MNDQESVIYIVDDDNAVLEALSSLVRSIGLRVKCFSSATAFLNDVGQLACGWAAAKTECNTRPFR